MLKQFTINTKTEEMISITKQVSTVVEESGIKEGICLVYCPHTTAAITINENADPTVKSDMLLGLHNSFPENANYRHMEGNSTAHIKSSTIGASEFIIIHKGKLVRGIWQDIYFMEFDGPRTRNFYVKVVEG